MDETEKPKPMGQVIQINRPIAPQAPRVAPACAIIAGPAAKNTRPGAWLDRARTGSPWKDRSFFVAFLAL